MYDFEDITSDDLLVMDEEVKWNNEDNHAFYEAIKAEGLRSFAEKGGLVNGCDMHALTPYWSNAQSILEVGAGYGRVIDYLTKHQFRGTITAIEQCHVLFEHLKKKFNRHENLYFLHADIRYLRSFHKSFDLIFMLWSGIADFSPGEQKLIFIKLAKLLNKGGKLIIDTLPPSTTPLGMAQCGSKRIYKQEINGAVVYTYSMSIDEINEYAQLAGFRNVIHTTYYTDTGRERLLHILG